MSTLVGWESKSICRGTELKNMVSVPFGHICIYECIRENSLGGFSESFWKVLISDNLSLC